MIRTIFFILIAAMAMAAAAQDAVPDATQAGVPEAAPAAFFIERIEVRNIKRVSSEVVIAESRLRAGQAYTEEQLRDASTRLSRLPFLLSVDFALEKGSERGQHVLVLNVVETKPFFYLLDFRPIFSGDRFPIPVYIDYSDRLGSSDTNAVLGFRWFVGPRGAFHSAVTTQDDHRNFSDDYSTVTAGYTQYDLFGTRAFATLNVKYPLNGYAQGAITPELVVGVPISPNQTVTLKAEETHLDSEYTASAVVFKDGTYILHTVDVTGKSTARTFSTRWAYNTTNHPFLPTRGTFVSVTPLFFSSDASTQHVFFDSETEEFIVTPATWHARTVALEAEIAQYWESSERDSWSVGVKGGLSEGSSRSTPDDLFDLEVPERDDHFGIIYGGWSHSLWSRERQRQGDSRIEVNGRYSNRSDYYHDEINGIQLSASWVRRSSWGTLRLGAGYAW